MSATELDALTRRLLVRASGAQLSTWTLAAELAGVPLSQWVREKLDGAVTELLGDT